MTTIRLQISHSRCLSSHDILNEQIELEKTTINEMIANLNIFTSLVNEWRNEQVNILRIIEQANEINVMNIAKNVLTTQTQIAQHVILDILNMEILELTHDLMATTITMKHTHEADDMKHALSDLDQA